LEKAIEIKRRAQRCILNGDLDGALSAYEKLVALGESDPYHSVLLADLLYKKGDHDGAGRRYLEAVDGYEKVSLFKNAIAVCKKMSRLSLASSVVLERLARLHALDGLTTESSLYYMQHAEFLARKHDPTGAVKSYGLAYEVCPDNVQALERLGEIYESLEDRDAAVRTMNAAAAHYERQGQTAEAARCRHRAETLSGVAAPRPSHPAPAGRFDDGPAQPEANPHEVEDAPRVSENAAVGGSPFVHERGMNGEATVASGPAAMPRISDIDHDPQSWANATPPGLEADPHNGLPDAPPSRVSPAPPALDLGARGGLIEPAEPPVASAPVAAKEPAEAFEPEPPVEPEAAPEVSVLLKEAQTHFQKGNREAASASLVKAAQAYDRTGKLDSAASIYRSLSQVMEAPLQVMLLWLKNCQRRDDRPEAARVACELGNRALTDGDLAGAREWFERAHSFDERNEMATRRLEHLRASAGESPVATVAEWIKPPAEVETSAQAPLPPAVAPREIAIEEPVSPAAAETDLVEVALDPGSFGGTDFGQMISEFQRGIDEQLANDPQGHYDLAMSYREMGLHDQAILSFRLAAQTPAFKVRTSEMIGRCLLEVGNFDEAARELDTAIKNTHGDPSATVDLRFQLGLALEAGGKMARALEQFETVYSIEPNYPDVASKIRGIRKTMEKT
jgi:tetratricopeptide (TPR) repeat protein